MLKNNPPAIGFHLPVYNEEKILEASILKLLDYLKKSNLPFAWKIIIVNNGSSDNTKNIAKNLSQKHQGISLFNVVLPGKGRALKKSFQKSQTDILVYMDIDLAVSLGHIKDLLEPIIKNQADLVFGSRLLPDSKIQRSFVRELSSQGYNFLSRLILNHKFSDLQCGFKAISREAFQKISDDLKDKAWFFDTELIVFAKKNNFRIKELPVDWSENRYDERKSKVKIWRDSLKFFWNLIKLKFRL